MHNIIDKIINRKYLAVLLICIIIVLFINSRKIIEGAKNKKAASKPVAKAVAKPVAKPVVEDINSADIPW